MNELGKLSVEQWLEGQLLLVDKPLGWSSFQAVNAIKWALIKHLKLKKIKIGHAGTLDPLASGLLLICVGKHTKLIEQFQGQEKTYTGTFTLGQTTPSYDLETPFDAQYPTEHIDHELLSRTRLQFVGEIAQVPPVFSALKKDGKRLYEYAREGKELELPSRTVNISSFDIDRSKLESTNEVDFLVKCSKGTYIRSLAHDFGKALNSGAHLSALRRTAIGDYRVENALIPDKIKEQLC
jgi:tRNA pseudouridine55 synthase